MQVLHSTTTQEGIKLEVSEVARWCMDNATSSAILHSTISQV